MENTIIKALESRFKAVNDNITLGDEANTSIIELIKREDTSLENILIMVYNTVKINTYKIQNLETNLDLLASRIYDEETDFTADEKEEIEEALSYMEDIEKLSKLNDFKEYLQDSFYAMEEDFDTMYRLQQQLLNKIKYPTKKQNDTFNDLVKYYIVHNAEMKIRVAEYKKELAK